jgi:hypothetical protein
MYSELERKVINISEEVKKNKNKNKNKREVYILHTK